MPSSQKQPLPSIGEDTGGFGWDAHGAADVFAAAEYMHILHIGV